MKARVRTPRKGDKCHHCRAKSATVNHPTVDEVRLCYDCYKVVQETFEVDRGYILQLHERPKTDIEIIAYADKPFSERVTMLDNYLNLVTPKKRKYEKVSTKRTPSIGIY